MENDNMKEEMKKGRQEEWKDGGKQNRK
jgi:hypothetical protein